MRSFTSLFRTAPSAEFTRPEHHGIQRVWKRLFEQLIERADVYKRTGFNNMHDVNKDLDEEIYLDLRVAHDALSIERDELMDTFADPEKLTSELVSRANSYKSRTKTFFIDVQKALEVAHDKTDSPWSLVEPLASYQFPERSDSSSSDTRGTPPGQLGDESAVHQGAGEVARQAMSRLHITIPTPHSPDLAHFEGDEHPYSALGLYNLQPGLPVVGQVIYPTYEEAPPFPEPRLEFGRSTQTANGTNAGRSTNGHRELNWQDDMLRAVPPPRDVNALRELLMNLPPDADTRTLDEFAGIVHVFAPAVDARAFIHECARRCSHNPDGRTERLRPDQRIGAAEHGEAPNAMLCPPAPLITPLRLRTFPCRTQDTLDDGWR